MRLSSQPICQPNPKDLAEEVKFQGIEDSLKSGDFNTLVLKSRRLYISVISEGNH